jgi:hypothetical protein
MTKETEDLVTKAIAENRPLYAARAVSGDGDYIETVRFNTFLESFQYAENMFSLGAEQVTFHILSVDDLQAEKDILDLIDPDPWRVNV